MKQVDFSSLFATVFQQIVKIETENSIKVETFIFRDGNFSITISDIALKYQSEGK